MKIKKNDTVVVVAGKDKGKQGRVEKVLVKEEKILVSGVNLYKRHMKARAQSQKSDIITIAKPLPIANVAFLCPKCTQQTRIGYKITGDTKVRICKKCDQEV